MFNLLHPVVSFVCQRPSPIVGLRVFAFTWSLLWMGLSPSNVKTQHAAHTRARGHRWPLDFLVGCLCPLVFSNLFGHSCLYALTTQESPVSCCSGCPWMSIAAGVTLQSSQSIAWVPAGGPNLCTHRHTHTHTLLHKLMTSTTAIATTTATTTTTTTTTTAGDYVKAS